MMKYISFTVFLTLGAGCELFSPPSAPSDPEASSAAVSSQNASSQNVRGGEQRRSGGGKVPPGTEGNNTSLSNKTRLSDAEKAAFLRQKQEDFQKALNEGRIGEAEQILLQIPKDIRSQTRGIDVSLTDKEGNTFLMLMVKSGRGLHEALKINSVRETVNAQRLFKNADGDEIRETAFTIALKANARFEYMKPLLDAMEDYPFRHWTRTPTVNPLMAAVKADRPDLVSELLTHSPHLAKYAVKNRLNDKFRRPHEITVFHEAVFNSCITRMSKRDPKKQEIIKLLLKAGADPLIPDESGKTSLNTAVLHECSDVLRETLKIPAVRRHVFETEAGRKALFDAVYSSSRGSHYINAYKLFFEETGIHPLSLNENGGFFISAALQTNDPVPFSMNDKNLLYLLQRIPDLSKHIDNQNKDGKTVLFHAAEYGYSKSVHWLLNAGADPVIPDNKGRSPLEAATDEAVNIPYNKSGGSLREKPWGPRRFVMDELLKRSAVLENLSERELERLSLSDLILRLAGRNTPKAKSLLQTKTAQSRLTQKPKRREKPLSFEEQHLQHPTEKAKDTTPLLELIEGAVSQEAVWAVSLFLEAGADPTVPDASGNTPLMIAAQDRQFDIDAARADAADIRFEILKELLKIPEVFSEENINAVNGKGETALLQAAARPSERTVSLLLEAGADPQIPDNDGNTPLITALAAEAGWGAHHAAAMEKELKWKNSYKEKAAVLHIVQKLLENPSVRENINAANDEGENALSIISGGSSLFTKKIVEALKKNGAKLPLPPQGKLKNPGPRRLPAKTEKPAPKALAKKAEKQRKPASASPAKAETNASAKHDGGGGPGAKTSGGPGAKTSGGPGAKTSGGPGAQTGAGEPDGSAGAKAGADDDSASLQSRLKTAR